MNPIMCGWRIRIFLNPLSRVEKKNKIRNESDNVWMANPDILESDAVAKWCPVSYRAINQYGGTTCRPGFSRVNPDTIGCGRVDRRIPFEYATCGRGNFRLLKEKVADSKISG